MKRSIFLAAVISASCLAFAQDLQDQLRLKAGNYWVYRGTVEWTYVNTTPARFGKKSITWKSEILEETRRGDLKAFLVLGSFFDLPWFEPGQKPKRYIWIVYQGRFYSIAATPERLARFRNTKDDLIDLVLAEDPILQLPLRLQKCTVEIKPEEPRQRSDLLYCWYFESRQNRTINAAGVSGKMIPVFSARYHTMPDHEVLGFAPGVGFVSFDFSHHGTLSEAHVKLIEARLQ